MAQPGDTCESYYDGEWQNDKQNGQGTYQYGCGRLYVGQFQDDLFHGQGKITYKAEPDDICEHYYEGEFHNGRISGTGTCQFGCGRLYVGQFTNFNMHGQGKFTWKAQPGDICETYCEGEFQNGLQHGYATFQSGRHGIVYTGLFKDGKKHGQGKMTVIKMQPGDLC